MKLDQNKSFSNTSTKLLRNASGTIRTGFKMTNHLSYHISQAIHVIRGGLNNGMQDTVQKLLFENHTECECQPINDTPRSLRSVLPPSAHYPGASNHHASNSWSSSRNPNSTPWRSDSTYKFAAPAPAQVTSTTTTSTTTTLAPPVTLDEETFFQLSGYNCPTNNK